MRPSSDVDTKIIQKIAHKIEARRDTGVLASLKSARNAIDIDSPRSFSRLSDEIVQIFQRRIKAFRVVSVRVLGDCA